MRQGQSPRDQSRFRKPEKSEKHAINEFITAPEVRLIGADGAPLGVVKLRDALQVAEESGLDLVEVAPEASPPVCRILDYGKLKYREQKKAAETRKRSSVHVLKELRVRYNTDKHDLDVKVRNARGFLEDGDKVKFEMRFKGREVVYVELGKQIFARIKESLKDVGVVEEEAPLFGTRMIMILVPKSGIAAKPH